MPIYGYICRACGYQFDKLVKLGEEVKKCDLCGKPQVQKLVSTPSFNLKGDGWHDKGFH